MKKPVSVRNKCLLLALASAFGSMSLPVMAADDKELAQIREEIRQMRASYESRMQALEQRLAEATAKNAKLQEQVDSKLAQTATPAPAAPATSESRANRGKAMSNAFNPAIALNLSGTYANLSRNPEDYRIAGFLPNDGEIGPGARSFHLGESELTLSANVDPNFFGQLTFALTPENEAEVEEAFVETRALPNGLKVRGGRFLSGIGYINSVHAHAWDFVDAPLVYQAMFGGRYTREGAQVKWLAPLDQFVEFGVELGNGGNFPGTTRNKNGFADSAVFARIGDDIGDSASWRLGLSYLRNKSQGNNWGGVDEATGSEVEYGFQGRARTMILDGVFKWAPQGNASKTNLKISGEYFKRNLNGDMQASLADSSLAAKYDSRQSGWYLQGVYQFAPQWRAGLRYDRLNSGRQNLGIVQVDGAPTDLALGLESWNPRKTSLSLDYLASEFSRIRLQFARDQSVPGRTDKQIFLQYNMSLGAHAAHAF